MFFHRRLKLPPFPQGALLVGGAARDLLRGAQPKDFDWMVAQPAQVARQLAKEYSGTAFPLDEELDYWRVSAPEGVQHDLVPQPEDLQQELLRRDFTVNALAIDSAGKVIDLCKGQADLKARRLRMVSAQNLLDDPLRVWRAARFVTTLKFKIEAQTEAQICAVVQQLQQGTLAMPAAERIREEMNALMKHPDAARGLFQLDQWGLLELTLPELCKGKGFKQGGLHHLNVFEHNIEALHQLLNRDPEAGLPLRWAALLHDVAKPHTHKVDPETGRQSFHGHDKMGGKITHDILKRLRFAEKDAKHAADLVKAHMVPLPQNEREARRFVHKRRHLLPDLLSLMLADREAARGPQSSAASRHAYAVGMDRVLAALEDQPQKPKPLLSGQQVIELLDIEPGPQVGQVMRALAEAAALGDVSDEQEARAFVLQWGRVGK